ncbi:hypothetical protein LMG1873_05018 [Achromobacter piechaudii]|uniref:Uncharacterized protein n=1 Tax=Achromobacter piechaudii TaxID=72556 RepID=A0ABM8L3X3_9BURK|nr:hypothetical protein LMG1873_05018 [Achromobacter piechaudii]CAB3913138.1 hypothetical protein LMG2828_05107 [Achromobacter piechaudii]CAB3955116.1 hypothetical protein LMG6103_04331 [Achromobacter piechaudii]
MGMTDTTARNPLCLLRVLPNLLVRRRDAGDWSQRVN